MKKSNKKIPKTHLPKFDRGGSSRASSDTTRTMYSGSEEAVTGNTQGSGGGMNSAYNEGRQSKISGNQYAQMGQAVAQGGMQAYQTSQTPGLSEYEKNQQYGNSIKSAETGVVSAINPIFGMIHAGVTAATPLLTAKATQTDEQGNLKNKNFAKADIIGQGFADPMAMIPTMISNKFSMKKYISSVEDDAKGKIAAQKAQEDAYAQQQTDYQNQQQSMMDAAFARGYANQNQTGGNTYVQYAKYGGQMKYAMGGMNMQPNAEIESEENVVAPNGGFLQANGPTHEQGGVPVALPGNSMIFSDRLKLGKKTFAELNKVNNTNKEDKVLESNKYGTTSKHTAELMKLAKNKNSQELFNAQEALKQAKVEAYAKKMGVALPQAQEAPEEGMQFAMGGVKLPMYPLGGGTDNTKFTPAQKQQAYTDSMTLYKSGFNKNIPNWQAEPGFNDAVLRLNKLNGTPPQSTDKSAITYDQSYLQKRSVPYAKPVAPKVNYQNKPSTITPNYPMEILPMKKLEYPEMEIKSDFKQVPANSPNTIKTNIVTGPNMSYKEYKQGNEVMDRMYFKPGTEEEIEVTGFKYGGKMLPKFWTGGKMVNGTWVPDNYDIITAHNATNSYKPGTIGYYDSMNSPDKPSNDSLQSSYGPDVLPWNRSNDSGNSTAYDNTVNPQQFQEVTSNSKSNIGSPKVTDPNDKNFDWGKLKTVGQNYGNFALQNAGNIYDLTRKKDPLQKYDRATAKFLDPSSAIRDALAQTRRAEYNVRGASGGNAGTYLSNRVALNAQNTENLARIHQNYQNANAQISNQNSQFNTEIAYREAEAQAKDRAMRQNVDSQAIHSMASNFGKMSKSSKQDNMEQKELDMFMYRYKNEPGFKEQVDKFRTA